MDKIKVKPSSEQVPVYEMKAQKAMNWSLAISGLVLLIAGYLTYIYL